jgi:anti-sigma B factor antagonist
VGSFDLSERELRPGCREIRVEGELDLAVAPQLERALARAGAEADRLLLIGLEECAFIDSTGIAIVMRAHNELAERGGRLAIYGAADQVERVLSITGLTDNGLVFEKADDALRDAGLA